VKPILLLLFSVALAQAQSTFQDRTQQVIRHYAKGESGYAAIAGKLKLRQDPAFASRQLLELLNEGPTGDMFWMFPVTAIAYLDQGQLTPNARAALKRSWKTYMPYRGDTENHWLLYYTSLYLMAQLWPDESGEAWFTGKSSAENRAEAAAWIHSWIDLTTSKGQGEYDCAHYIGVYLLPMSYLAEWCQDPLLKKRARMMMDYLIADYAVENLDGQYIGSHARTDDRMVLDKTTSVAADFGWLLFGLGQPNPNPAYYAFCYSLAAAYEPPEILRRIATDRSAPYLHYELKRTRNRWRLAPSLHGRVYKTAYVRKEYAVGSDQGGVLQPIQQHSWDVTWSLPDARGKHNTLFTVHPFSSNQELLSYFTFSPDAGTEGVVRSKKTYDSPDKFLGGSPYEQIFQDRDTVIVLYDIPRETRFPHINGFFSKDLDLKVEHPSGWIFCRGGDTWIAYRPLAGYEWKPIEGGGQRLFSPYLKNGAIVQAAPVADYPNLESFQRAILALPLTFALEPTPKVTFRSLSGRSLAFTYGQTPTVDGRALDYANWPLFSGPFLEAAPGSKRLTLKHGTLRRTLDFTANTVTDGGL
jgi:hypothetical protein